MWRVGSCKIPRLAINSGASWCGNASIYSTLLILHQIQGNFLIRRTQADIAMQMISPQSGNNIVMQVNIGEGKSSVIIPIVAAALADGNQLVRVIVPKALTVQMVEILVARLGGLVNRPVYHLPFSRTPQHIYHGNIVDDLKKLMLQCMCERGILLIQPEDVVSLRLMSIEQQTHKAEFPADSLTQKWKPIYKQIVTAASPTSVSIRVWSVMVHSAEC